MRIYNLEKHFEDELNEMTKRQQLTRQLIDELNLNLNKAVGVFSDTGFEIHQTEDSHDVVYTNIVYIISKTPFKAIEFNVYYNGINLVILGEENDHFVDFENVQELKKEINNLIPEDILKRMTK